MLFNKSQEKSNKIFCLKVTVNTNLQLKVYNNRQTLQGSLRSN